MSRPADNHSIRRVILPNGRTVDVLFMQGDAAPPERALEPTRTEGMHVCPACASQLVVPLDWDEAGPAHWDVTLYCPNCDWLDGGVFDEAAVERFDEELDRGTEALVLDLQRLTRANMEDEIDRFAAALAAGAILPEDF